MISIRAATISDLETLLPLVQAYRVFYEQQPDPRRERDFIQAHLQNATSHLFIALYNGETAGFMQLFTTHSTVYLGPALILEDLFVAPAHRKHGVATALLAHAVEYARSTGATGMFLETAYTNKTAQNVYEHAGWTRENRFYKYNAPLAVTAPELM